MESCKPMMRKLAVSSNTLLFKCYFVPALRERDIAGSSKRLDFKREKNLSALFHTIPLLFIFLIINMVR